MSDVTALVLSIGEEYTERAIASVRRQTLPVTEIIVVQGISPFYRALNSGAARVRTEFFIQVDADMILDDTCVEVFRSSVSDEVGAVVGHLRDPLLGRIVGIKLFRTRCFGRVKFRDSTSPETNFVQDIQREGWTIVSALKYKEDSPAELHGFGEHRPDYNPYYTFCKYVREGAKARYRKAGGGLRSVFRQLQTSDHGCAMIATIAAAHGIFVREDRDLSGPFEQSEGFEFLERFLRNLQKGEDPPVVQDDLMQRDLRKGFKRSYDLGVRLLRHYAPSTFMTYLRQLHQERDLRKGFKRSYDLGIRLRQHKAPSAFIPYLRQLHQEDSLASWVALVGLCHGLFVDEYREAEAEEAFALLRDLLQG